MNRGTKNKGQSTKLNNSSSFYSEIRIESGRLDADFLKVIDPGPLRSGYQIFLKFLNVIWGTFGEYFHFSIRKVTHVTINLMARGGALSEEAITHSLHLARDEKLPRRFG